MADRLIELLYENNVRCDIGIESLAEDIRSIFADVQPVSKWMSDLCIVCGRDVRKDSTYYDINGATVCEGCMGVSCKVEKEE